MRLISLQKIVSFNNDEEIMVGKGENTGDHHFLFFKQCFLLFQRLGIKKKLDRQSDRQTGGRINS